jgi:AcrR family transcriptional regulator
MPKVSEMYLEARRQQVLDAAYTCFAQNGFYETTMQDIAREAGVSYGVVYHYFQSKEDVIEASWKASHEAREVRFRKAMEKTTIPDVLAEFLDTSVSRLEQPESILEMRLRVQLFGEALINPRISEKLLGVWDEVFEMLEEIIRRGQELGEINPDIDTRALARAYIAVHDGLILQKTLDPEVDIWKLTDVFWAMHRGELWKRQKTERDDHENTKEK